LPRRSTALGAGGVLALGGAAALIAAVAGIASASTTLTVDSNSDGVADAAHCTDSIVGNCTLRDAASAAGDGDTINFDPSITEITLSLGEVGFPSVALVGPGSSSLHIVGAGAADQWVDFYIGGSGDAVISGLSLSKYKVHSKNAGALLLDDVSISGAVGWYGGALYAGNDGDLGIMDSTFENNFADSGNGGGVYAYNTGSVTISDSSFTNNAAAGYGGAVFTSNRSGKFTMENCTVTGNDATYGGGVFLSGTDNASFSDSTISNNDANTYSGGGVWANNQGTLAFDSVTLDANHTALIGGGVYTGQYVGDVLLVGTTISNNRSENATRGGGGLLMWGSGNLEIDNSTLTGNSSGREGGALYLSYGVGSEIHINQSTIVGNSAVNGGGIKTNGNPLFLSGSIVSANSASNGYADIAGGNTLQVLDADHSLIGVYDSVNFGYPNLVDTLLSSTPGVGALMSNGGPTRTMALLIGSAAIDAGPNPVATFVGDGFDQRGTPWLRIFNGRVDIGAFEFQSDPAPSTTTTTDPSEPLGPVFTG